jgi:hypothetical protein
MVVDIVGCIVVVDTVAGYTVVGDIAAARTCFGYKIGWADRNLVDMAGSSFGWHLGQHRKNLEPEEDSESQKGTAVGPVEGNLAIGLGREEIGWLHCMAVLGQLLGMVTAC